jgi:hypothetical protein
LAAFRPVAAGRAAAAPSESLGRRGRRDADEAGKHPSPRNTHQARQVLGLCADRLPRVQGLLPAGVTVVGQFAALVRWVLDSIVALLSSGGQ